MVSFSFVKRVIKSLSFLILFLLHFLSACLFSPGYHTLLALLAVRCLPHHTFLQYIDHGVLQLTETFVSRLMTGTHTHKLKHTLLKLPLPICEAPQENIIMYGDQVLNHFSTDVSVDQLAFLTETIVFSYLIFMILSR